ncbi:lysylphosphatidylglycerol synthase transmembrane domain-containing protein [Longimycelium tulufanense]|uniref:lysylphosphatidylglycerol synthase transmembrane domain-containing protein n=1 Tax=Longimycelium tulufanense TaxID=907463 RepID=UPI001E359201|nr:lysylphosphatidylglycerol synthase transmembrane domain-containing protein [Longimycelium tulufanense]
MTIEQAVLPRPAYGRTAPPGAASPVSGALAVVPASGDLSTATPALTTEVADSGTASARAREAADTVGPEGASAGKAGVLLRRGLLVLVLAGAAWALVAHWHQVWATVLAVPGPALVASMLALLAGLVAGTVSWRVVVDDLGEPVGTFRGAQIMLVGQLGKYVPGSVWAYLLQMELGRAVGLPRARIFTASLLHVGIGVVGSLVLGLLALPVALTDHPETLWLFLLLPVGLAALHPRVLSWGASRVLRLLRRSPLERPLQWPVVLRALGLVLLSYTLFGLHLWLLATSLGARGWSGLTVCIGAMAMGLVVGMFAFLLPSGLGAREAVVVAALLASGMSVVEAGAFAALSRMMFTVADLAMAGGAALLARWRAPAPVSSVPASSVAASPVQGTA